MAMKAPSPRRPRLPGRAASFDFTAPSSPNRLPIRAVPVIFDHSRVKPTSPALPLPDVQSALAAAARQGLRVTPLVGLGAAAPPSHANGSTLPFSPLQVSAHTAVSSSSSSSTSSTQATAGGSEGAAAAVMAPCMPGGITTTIPSAATTRTEEGVSDAVPQLPQSPVPTAAVAGFALRKGGSVPRRHGTSPLVPRTSRSQKRVLMMSGTMVSNKGGNSPRAGLNDVGSGSSDSDDDPWTSTPVADQWTVRPRSTEQK